MEISKVFDELSDQYTEKIKRWVPYYQELLNAAKDSLGTTISPSEILDLGCGNGNLTALLTESFPQANYYMLDASKEMIQLAKARFSSNPRIQFHEDYFQNVQFPDSTFDLVVAAFSLHHLKSEEKVTLISNIFGWLKPGGRFVYIDLMIDKRAKEHSRLIDEWKNYAFAHQTSEDEWTYIMEHYASFDFPDSREKTSYWLKESGFNQMNSRSMGEWWTIIVATKSG